MKIFYSSLLLILSLFQCSSCKKETITPIDFSKFTSTNSSCAIIGNIDSTDWTNDAEWNTAELAFMKFGEDILIVDSTAGNIEVSPLCPNPGEGIFEMQTHIERQCKMKVACVNTDWEIIYYNAYKLDTGINKTTFDFRTLTSFPKDQYYRMYYAFYTALDSVYYKGHGDFRIE